jgi:3-oxoacyl-(acyl-carrier-protein) synthase
MAIYIQTVHQISAQCPLSDDWFERPVFYNEPRVATLDPHVSDYLSPLMSRRMCTLLKRAVVMSRLTLKEAGVEMPDAILTGTGLGCIDNTEKFLVSIMENGEKFLQPTFFMQSTHNVISSTIAIDLKCHGYNNSFVHRGVSFEHALFDALLQLEQKRIKNALVGGYDELTDNYYILFGKMGFLDFQPGNPDASPKNRCFAAEASVSMLLRTEKDGQTCCEVNDLELMFRPTYAQMREALDRMLAKAGCGLSDIDAVLTGINTNPANDAVYFNVVSHVLEDRPMLQYKHVFGESFSASALAVYVAAVCLQKGRIPSFLFVRSESAPAIEEAKPPRRILVYNHYKNKSHSFILLSSCSN